MRPAIVKQRRQLADGRRLVNVVCPACEGRHWLPAARSALHFNSDARMGYEMQLAAVQAAIERGETETPTDGI
jgi:hypothetical protein